MPLISHLQYDQPHRFYSICGRRSARVKFMFRDEPPSPSAEKPTKIGMKHCWGLEVWGRKTCLAWQDTWPSAFPASRGVPGRVALRRCLFPSYTQDDERRSGTRHHCTQPSRNVGVFWKGEQELLPTCRAPHPFGETGLRSACLTSPPETAASCAPTQPPTPAPEGALVGLSSALTQAGIGAPSFGGHVHRSNTTCAVPCQFNF